MTGTNKAPSAERILSILVDLYADQMGVKVKYQIETSEEAEGHKK
jgi:hypothetical protein